MHNCHKPCRPYDHPRFSPSCEGPSNQKSVGNLPSARSAPHEILLIIVSCKNLVHVPTLGVARRGRSSSDCRGSAATPLIH